MTDATQAVAQAQAALAAAQEAAAQEAATAKAEGDSEAAIAAEANLGKGIGPHIGDLIRRVEALEKKVFDQPEASPKSADTPQESPQDTSYPVVETPAAFPVDSSRWSPPSYPGQAQS